MNYASKTSTGDLICIPANNNHFLIMWKNDKERLMGCRLVKSDITIEIDYDTVNEMFDKKAWAMT
jgi:bifunctional pyridoxal-dependent enzyme with beta-cystathionase and maltose regulon repressor activities